MLVKSGFEGIAHFINHPEMLPHVGNGVLIVGECVNLPGDFFSNKAEAFMHWYDEPTPRHFVGMSEDDWRMSKVYFDVQQTVCRNYDKYAKPKEPRLFYEVSELYNKVIEEIFKRRLNPQYMYYGVSITMGYMHRVYAIHSLENMLEKNSKERWKDCSFCTYYQRPNLMAGEFKEIMPNEDRYAFEIFNQIVSVISPKLIIVLSAKASASIKSLAGDNLPANIHFFDSPYPSSWSKESRQEFINAIESLTMREVKFHLQNWIETTGTTDRYFTSMVEEVLVGFSDEDVSPLSSLDELLATEGKYLLQRNPINLDSRRPNWYREKKLNLNKPEIPWFNAYPLKIETNRTFPLFLAICRGDETLNMVLEKILEQAQKIVEVYPEDEIVKRNVVLLTDKWNEEIWRDYQEKFFAYSRMVKFIFSLVTEQELKILPPDEQISTRPLSQRRKSRVQKISKE